MFIGDAHKSDNTLSKKSVTEISGFEFSVSGADENDATI